MPNAFHGSASRKPVFPAPFIVQMGIIYKNIIPHDASFSNRERAILVDFIGFSALSQFTI